MAHAHAMDAQIFAAREIAQGAAQGLRRFLGLLVRKWTCVGGKDLVAPLLVEAHLEALLRVEGAAELELVAIFHLTLRWHARANDALGALRIEAADATQLRHHGIALRGKLALVRYMLPTAAAAYARQRTCRQHAIGRRRNELNHVAFAKIALVAIDFDQGDISRARAVHEYGFAIFRAADTRIAIGKAIDGNSFWHSSSFSRKTF